MDKNTKLARILHTKLIPSGKPLVSEYCNLETLQSFGDRNMWIGEDRICEDYDIIILYTQDMQSWEIINRQEIPELFN